MYNLVLGTLLLAGFISDSGGNIAEFEKHIRNAPPRQITGQLDSAATLWLTNAACISPRAAFGFHEARNMLDDQGNPVPYRYSVRNERVTQILISEYPACVRRIIRRDNAMGSGNLKYYSGSEILTACPQIPACV